MRARRCDEADDRHRGDEHVRDDLAHAGDKAARRVEAQDDDFGASFGRDAKAVLHISCGRRADRPVDRDHQRQAFCRSLRRCRRTSHAGDEKHGQKSEADRFHGSGSLSFEAKHTEAKHTLAEREAPHVSRANPSAGMWKPLLPMPKSPSS